MGRGRTFGESDKIWGEMQREKHVPRANNFKYRSVIRVIEKVVDGQNFILNKFITHTKEEESMLYLRACNKYDNCRVDIVNRKCEVLLDNGVDVSVN